MAVFGYCRVSTTRQVDEGESLDVQQRQLQDYAHMHGLALSEIAVEKGVSGSVPVEMPSSSDLAAYRPELVWGFSCQVIFGALFRPDLAAPRPRSATEGLGSHPQPRAAHTSARWVAVGRLMVVANSGLVAV